MPAEKTIERTLFESDVWNAVYYNVHVEHFDWVVQVDGSGFPMRCSPSSVKFTEVRTQGNTKEIQLHHYFVFETLRRSFNRTKASDGLHEDSNFPMRVGNSDQENHVKQNLKQGFN